MPGVLRTMQEPSPALDQYAQWRPRIARGVTWAGTSAFLAKTMGGDKYGPKVIVPLTVGAGLAGLADATLEDKVRENKHLKSIAERAFDKKAAVEDPRPFSPETMDLAERGDRDVLKLLFARKDETANRARKQLQDAYPQGGASQENLGRAMRLTPGGGSVRSLFRDYRPLAR